MMRYFPLLWLLVVPVLGLAQPCSGNISDLKMESYGANQITISWSSSGTPAGYEVRYGPSGSITAGGKDTTLSSPYTITGLNPNFDYDIQVRDSCSATSKGSWSSSLSIQTACNPVKAPFTAGFDGAAWTPPNFPQSGTINSCWQREQGANTSTPMEWTTGPPQFINQAGASDDHSPNNVGQYVMAQVQGFSTGGDSAIFRSPLVDLDTITNPEARFWYHMYGSATGDLRVAVSNDFGATYTQVFSKSGQQQTSSNAAWKEAIINLNAYAGDTVRLRFVATSNTGSDFNQLISVDDVSFQPQPSCPRPQNLRALSNTSNQVRLDWLSGGAAQWQVSYGTPGFNPGSGTILTTTNKPYSLKGLSSNTRYEVYVRDSCGPGDLSLWEGPISVRTACTALSAPYSENFDGNNFSATSNFFGGLGTIGPCWRRNDTTGYIWDAGPPSFNFTNTGPTDDHTPNNSSGGFLVTIQRSFTSEDTPRIFSPQVELSSLSVPRLRFYAHIYGNAFNYFEVAVDSGQGYQPLLSINTTLQTSGSARWREFTTSLANYANDTIQLRFTGVRANNGRMRMAIDDLYLEETPSCPKPDSLSPLSTGTNAASFNWTSGGASNWQLSYGTNLSAPGNGTLVNVSNRPFTLNGLSANTSYNVFVRDSCGPSDLSNWYGPITIQTRCAPITAPYTQRFDGNNLNTGNFSGLGDLPSCWQRDSATSFSWDILTGNGLNFQSGPSDDHSPSGANYLSTRRNNSFNDQSASTTVRMPPIDLDTLSRARIRFYYHVNDQNFDSLKLVNRPPGQGTSVLWRTDSTPQVQPGDPWLEEYVDLSSFTGDTIWLEWQASRNNTANFLTPEIAIDDIFIENAPLCQRPNQLVVSTLGSTTATLDWNSGGANNWQLEYGPPGFNPGSGTRINVTSKPFQITGLNPGKDYQVVVRDSCGANSLSRWTPPASFTTTCAVAQAPFLETFDGASFKIQTFNNNRGSISACWARSDSSAEYYWLPLDAGTNNTGPANDHTSGNGNFMATDAQFSGTANNAAATFTSPQIDLSPLNTPQLRFYEHRFGSDIDSLKVFVNDGSGWNQVLALAGANLNAGNAPWTEQLVGLSAYAGDTVQVRFRGVRTNTFFSRSIIGLDDFEIRESPSCPRPTQLNVTNTTNTSLTLDWTSSANNWIISYKEAGINNPQRTATASKPFTLTGLQPSTTYVITIQDSCGPNDISLDSDSLLARTDCGVANAPFTENFDGALWQEANFSNQFNASIDSCWSTTGADSDFAPGQGASGFNSSGPDQDVSGSGKYLFTPYDFQTNSGEITSPRIFIPNSLLNPYLKYGYFLYGSGISQFDVEISRVGSSGSTVLSSYTSQTQTSSTAAWLFDSLSLDAYQGDTVQITFTNNTSSFFSEAAIDAFELNGTPSPCSKPDSFQVSALSPTELSLSWTGQNNNSQGFTLIYYPVAQGTSGADTLSGLSSPYSLTNLNPNTNYRLLLLDSCSSGFPSAKLSQTFKTPVCPAVSASFTDSTQFLTAFYTASNTATADSLVWLLGNGDTSFLPNPQVNYSSSGSYSVTLKVFNDCGNIDSVTRNIQVCDTLQASFSYTTQGDTVVLDGSGSQNATSWRWLLGNGRSVGGQFALATFPNTNQSYPITLVVSNACGEQDSITQTVAFCDPPKADWTFSVLNPTGSGLRIQFDGTNSQNAQSYQWDFGDGATGTGPNPIHIYSTPGFFYQVTLVVTNDCGEQDSLSLTLQEVSLPEQAAFSSVEAYPNPAHEQLQLRWNPGQVQLKTLLLRNSKGQAVQERQMENSGQERLDISRLPAGAYWLEIHSSTGARHSRTIIIE